jgi:hypothetical protein
MDIRSKMKKIIRKLKCMFGWHNWYDYIDIPKDDILLQPSDFGRKCFFCGKHQTLHYDMAFGELRYGEPLEKLVANIQTKKVTGSEYISDAEFRKG